MRTPLALVLLLSVGCNGAPDPLVVVGEASNLSAAVLSVWAPSPDDVWMVGADDGSGPLVLRWNGEDWARLDTGSSGDLWWVWSTGRGDVWMVGDAGRVLRYDRGEGTFTESVVTNAAYKLFGVWGTAEDDVYVVGGEINGTLDGVVVHWDGTDWTEVATTPGNDTVAVQQAFKVWGSGPDDVWVVGTGALILHFDGEGWETVPPPVFESAPLTTVHGSGPGEVYAVGGFGNAVVARLEGESWSDDSPAPKQAAPYFNGVFSSAEHGTVACGGFGSLWWREDGAWQADPREPASTRAYHACAIDDQGAVWAVGGDLTSLDEGLVVYGGAEPPPFISP